MLHENCTGCPRVSGDGCSTYENPSYWWEVNRAKRCPFASVEKEGAVMRKRNPLKDKDIPLPMKQGSRCAKKWPSSGIKTPKRLQDRKGQSERQKA
jgi:hypothetical protein